ncbi:RIP metalloprotease RseP [soil metagenome]
MYALCWPNKESVSFVGYWQKIFQTKIIHKDWYLIMLLAIIWGEIGMKVGQLLLSLSILVVLHEFGHYITAKWFGCRVEKFYLFFDPWFSLFKKKVGETEYGVGWLPLGGYVKISGMVDESMDKDALKLPPQPWEFRSKPAWQRLIIMIGGVTVNILLAFVIYAMVLFGWGEYKMPLQQFNKGLIINDSLMYEIGLKDGDKVLSVNNEPVVYYEELTAKLILGESVQIQRNGEKKEITLPVNFIEKLVEKKRSRVPLFSLPVPVLVSEVPDTSNAFKAGLRNGDVITAIDSMKTPVYSNLQEALQASKGKQVLVTVNRKGKSTWFKAPVSSEGRLGFRPANETKDFAGAGVVDVYHKTYSFFGAFPAGVKMAGEQLQFYIAQFKKILSPSTGAYKAVGGFKSMGSIFPAEWDWESFWKITAFFSIVLAFMNLLPIPALDGGHVVFTLVEMISGRKPSQKFLEYAQVVGMVLLLSLMLYANGNDWFGWGRGK